MFLLPALYLAGLHMFQFLIWVPAVLLTLVTSSQFVLQAPNHEISLILTLFKISVISLSLSPHQLKVFVACFYLLSSDPQQPRSHPLWSQKLH